MMRDVSVGFLKELKNVLLDKKERKIFVFLPIILVVPMFIFGQLIYISAKDQIILEENQQAEEKIKLHAANMQALFDKWKSDTQTFTLIPQVKDLVAMRRGEGKEQGIVLSEEELRERLADTFVSIAQVKPSYIQLRYIDETGMEVVRVNNVSGAMSVPKEELQNKADRYYFIDAIGYPKGAVYSSPIDLNREGTPSEIEKPIRPVIRYAAPVFDSKGNNAGLIVINVSTVPLGEFPCTIHACKQIALLDNEGYYLFHSDKTKEWSGPRDFNTGERIQKDYSKDISEEILQSKEGVVHSLSASNEVVFFSPVFTQGVQGDYFLIVLASAERNLFFEGFVRFKQYFILNTVVLLLLFCLTLITSLYFLVQRYRVGKAKTEFVSLASHQLRTPLSAINWYSEMLLDGDVGKLTPEQQDYVEEINKGSTRMTDLVGSLLDISRIELGTFSVEPRNVALTSVVEEVLHEMKLVIENKKHTITKQFGDTVRPVFIDPKIVRIVVQNLISNAVKYTPDGGSVEITVADIKQKEMFGGRKMKQCSICFSVKDSGYGVPKDEQKNIFSKLYRAQNILEMNVEGTGLGLYLVRQVILESGGDVWFESELNKGTSFYVYFPAVNIKED